MNLKRAIWINVLVYVVTFVVGIGIVVALGIDATSSLDEIPQLVFIAGAFAAVIVTALGAWWYFRPPQVQRSAKEGFLFGLVAVIVGFLLDILATVPTLVAGDGLLASLLAYYVEPWFWVTLVLVLLAGTGVGALGRRDHSPGKEMRKAGAKRVIVFGAFDPLNEGQQDFLRQAKKLGDHLMVVVAHDSAIHRHKKREPNASESERMHKLEELGLADEILLGRKTADKYHILGELDFDVIAMGYNQEPVDAQVRAELDERGKHKVEIVRLKPFKPELYPPN